MSWRWLIGQHPKIRTVRNGDDENLPPLQGKMRAVLVGAGAIRPAPKRVSGLAVPAFHDLRQGLRAVTKSEGERDLVRIEAPYERKRRFLEISRDESLDISHSLLSIRRQLLIGILAAEAGERLALPRKAAAQEIRQKFVAPSLSVRPLS